MAGREMPSNYSSFYSRCTMMNAPIQTSEKRGLSKVIQCCLAGLSIAALNAAAAEEPSTHEHHHPAAHSQATPSRSEHAYRLPEVNLVRQDGAEIALPAELNDGRAVVVNFVFTSCSAICPMLSQVFGQIQTKLGKDRKKVHLVSFSIDPEQDTPKRLRAFGDRFKAQPGWDFYTGPVQATIEVQKAFDVYRGDKMSHEPVLLLRKAPDQPWIRFAGFVSPKAVIDEYRKK
jgi:protein SCO1